MAKRGSLALWALFFVSLCFGFLTFRGDANNGPSKSEKILRLRRRVLTDDEASRAVNAELYQRKHRGIRSIRNTTAHNDTGSRNLTLRRLPPVLESLTAPPPEFATLLPPVIKLEVNCGNKVLSCSNKCTNTTTYGIFSSFRYQALDDCYCDKACNDVFMDCCSNYEQSCSMNSEAGTDDFYKHKSSWRCTTMNVSMGGCAVERGLWMIARCPKTWSNNDVKRKCHNPAWSLDAPQSLRLFLPVVGLTDMLTYRNQYCAICNDVPRYEFWTLIFEVDAIPPAYYTPHDFEKFIASNSQYLDGIRPKEGQRIRECVYPDVISTCPNTTKEQDMKDCLDGTTGLVKGAEGVIRGKIFKNKACASCNGHSLTCGVSKISVNPCSIDGSAISRAISLSDYGFSTTTQTCRRNEVYDTFLGKCRQTYAIKKLNAGSVDEYQVTLSLLRKSSASIFLLNGVLEQAILNYFKVNESQIADVTIQHLSTIENGRDKSLIIFKIQLTQEQSLVLASDPNLNGTSNDTITLRRLFKFTEAFQLPIGFYIFTVFRQQTRQLSCTRPHVYQHKEYVFLDELKVRILSTGAIYQQFEYYMNSTVENASVTVCLKLASPQCNGSFIKLNSSEYHFTNNLTLVYNSLLYKVGDYVYNKGVVFICVDFEREYTSKNHKSAPTDDLALVILTWIGFILSIIGLLVLLVTYIIFKDLRTLPGKNLMNLCVSLCLAEIVWLIGSTLDSYPTTCTVIAIANHYFFLVFFTASSAIAFHSCLVFGRKITFRRRSTEDNKIFMIYSLFVWGIPGLFVLIFGLLDYYEVFITDYGKSVVCWLGTKESKIFLFILPFGILLLFNLFLFLLVALRLRENQKSSAKALGREEVRKREAQNVKVCLKLSTLMGFSWLFGLLQVAVETETDVFAYLFIIFVSFQGLFICAAFLFQRKCYQLYSDLLTKSFGSSKGTNCAEQSTPSNTRKTCTRATDTKL